MKKVVIVPFNTDLNRGDQALVWETAKIIKDVYSPEPVEIYVLESGNTPEEVLRQSNQTAKLGYKVCDPILKHPGRYWSKESQEHVSNGFFRVIKWGLVAVLDFMRSVLLLSRCSLFNRIGDFFLSDRAKKTVRLIREADSIFVKGGGFIHAYGKITDAYQMYYSTFSMLLASRYNKSILMMPNSIGPLMDKLSRSFVAKLLKQCVFISVREHVSYHYLKKELRISCFNYPDLGYYLRADSEINPNDYMGRSLTSGKNIVGITLRPWRFPEAKDPAERYGDYISAFSEFIQYLNGKGYFVCLFVHTLGPSAHENDEIAINDVIAQLRGKGEFEIIKDANLNCYDVMKLYSKCSYFIGTRFHSVIFSQNQNVPTIAISYGGNKGNGIMNDLGLSRFVLNISAVSLQSLQTSFEDLVMSSDTYRSVLETYREELWKKRVDLIKHVKELLH